VGPESFWGNSSVAGRNQGGPQRPHDGESGRRPVRRGALRRCVAASAVQTQPGRELMCSGGRKRRWGTMGRERCLTCPVVSLSHRASARGSGELAKVLDHRWQWLRSLWE